MFLTWNAVVLGSIGPTMMHAAEAGQMIDPLALLRQGGAGDILGKLISVFSEVAIITSFTGFVYGLKDFFKDAIFSNTLQKTGTRHLTHNQVGKKGRSSCLLFIFLLSLQYLLFFSSHHYHALSGYDGLWLNLGPSTSRRCDQT